MEKIFQTLLLTGLFASAASAQNGDTITEICATSELTEQACACAVPIAEEAAANSDINQDMIVEVFASLDGSGDNAETVVAAVRELRGEMSREDARAAAQVYVDIAKQCVK